ncbi:MAG: DUF2142 domain-containing protein [Propionibacteriales bacterium]|nr:DUF2142 domain-containing protein [Propionibacteriales bacterium]
MSRTAATNVRRWVWLAYPVLLLITLAMWAWSSPAGSSPDEDYHLATAWCSHGTRAGLCTPGSIPPTRMVPAALDQVSCYAGSAHHSGSCPSASGMVETSRGDFAGAGPSGFAWVMGLFAGKNVGTSVLMMRLFNVVVHVLGLTALLWLAAPGRRASYLLVSLVSLVPLGLFTIASANPSSWALTSAFLVWAGAVELGRTLGHPQPRRARVIALAAIMGLGLVLAFASRTDAAAYAGLAIGLAWLATARSSRRSLISGLTTLSLMVVSFTWFATHARTDTLSTGTATPGPDGWLADLLRVPELWAGAFGYTRLGWLDTTMPPLTWVSALVAAAMIWLWGLRHRGWRKIAASAIVFTAAAVTPLLASLPGSQFTAQARTVLPLLIIAILIAVVEDNPIGPQFSLAQATTVLVLVAAAQAAALHTNLRRYVTGTDKFWFSLNHKIEWWWPTGPSPMLVFAIGSVAFTLAALVATLGPTLRRRTTSATAEPTTAPTPAEVN